MGIRVTIWEWEWKAMGMNVDGNGYDPYSNGEKFPLIFFTVVDLGGSVAKWLACTKGRRRARVKIAVATLSGNSLRQTVHTHLASVHQAAKLVATLLRVAEVTAAK